MDKVKEVLEKLIRNTSDGDTGYAVSVNGKKFIPKAQLHLDALYKEFYLGMLPEERVHSQLCNKTTGGVYGKDGIFEMNCGCIAYGFNSAIEETKRRINDLDKSHR